MTTTTAPTITVTTTRVVHIAASQTHPLPSPVREQMNTAAAVASLYR